MDRINIEQSKISVSIRDLVNGFTDTEELGVYAFGGKLNVRPAYQREFVYDDKKRALVIDSVASGIDLGKMYWSVNDDGSYELLDGQQRTISICQYCTNAFSMEFEKGVPMFFKNLDDEQRESILNYTIDIVVCKGTTSEKLKLFQRLNVAGAVLTDQELLNAVYTGKWLTDAKKRFSKTGCVAYKIGNKLLTGAPIRQDYLETALDWISNGEKGGIAKYMSDHQNDSDALPLWNYFNNVIEWVNTKFPNYRREMKGVDWGLLYNQYKDNSYDAEDLEVQIKALMMDDDVTAKKGIYEYLLSGGAKENKLSIRAFTESQKRAAYEKQGGICPICGEFHEYEDMEGDHITPWSQGGKTTPDNLQMICKSCNRKKSDK
jgi:hypothetical protein